jgi:hypothetical protein
LTLKPYFKATEMPDYFDGTVKISFTCKTDTYKLVLHSKWLDIDNSTLRLSSDTDSNFDTISDMKWTYDSITHFVTFNLPDQVFRANNNYTFSASFKGYTKDDGLGFFRTSYLDSENTRKFDFNF